MDIITPVKHILGERDELGGQALEDGEELKILFPDGTQVTNAILVKETLGSGDAAQGLTVSPLYKRAFIIINYHGTTRWITIAGLQAQRV